MNNYTIILPVFNDWDSLAILLRKIEYTVKNTKNSYKLIIVNDSSSIKNTHTLNTNNFFQSITVLNLKKNIGSQKAIATAIKYVEKNHEKFGNKYIIMDSDGEDDPNKILEILDLLKKKNDTKESILFSIFYELHLFITFLITLNYIRFGNFSFLNLEAVKIISSKKELWLAYSATINKYLKNKIKISAPRKNRIKGKSKMSYFDLIKHSINIQKVYFKNIILSYIAYLALAFLVSNFLFNFLIFLFLIHFFILKFSNGTKNEYIKFENCLKNII